MQISSEESAMHGQHHDSMPIGELSERTGVSVRALRYYEQNDLLNAVRTSAGHRRFPSADVENVRRIRLLLNAGLSLAIVSQVTPCFLNDGARLHACVSDYLREHLETIRARMEALDDQQDATRLLQQLIVA